MKLLPCLAMAYVLFLNNAWANEVTPPSGTPRADSEIEVEVAPSANGATVNATNSDLSTFCFFSSGAPSDKNYTVVRKLKLGKGSYGSVTDILPKFAERARNLGADAIINYSGSQRFGFFPWRIVRPVVRGTAIKWASSRKQDCSAMGGSTLNTILSTNRPPTQ